MLNPRGSAATAIPRRNADLRALGVRMNHSKGCGKQIFVYIYVLIPIEDTDLISEECTHGSAPLRVEPEKARRDGPALPPRL